MADFDQYDVILAMKRDGEAMPIRDKGPLCSSTPTTPTRR